MNFEKFIQETKEYLNEHLSTSARGDLHVLPQTGKEDLLHYIQSLHSSFSRLRFSRFIEKLKEQRLVLDSNESSVTFDPTFPY
jgi:hypothetical protein